MTNSEYIRFALGLPDIEAFDDTELSKMLCRMRCKCDDCPGYCPNRADSESSCAGLEIWLKKDVGCKSDTEVVIYPDGKHPLELKHRYEQATVLHNVTVEILKCRDCGEESVGWYRQDDTYEETP